MPSEPTVQVPVSLIERIRDTYAGRDFEAADAAVAALLNLLSQPTPTAEPELVYTTMPVLPAAPPRIEDMAPGTTFTEASDGWPRTLWTVGQRHDGTRYAKRQSDGWVLDPKNIDPSTIRDVTPPSEA